MKTFHLIERADGRVVLSNKLEKGSHLIRDIKAENWKAARATIPADEFFHDPGHGYFIHPRPGAYQRANDAAERATAALLPRSCVW